MSVTTLATGKIVKVAGPVVDVEFPSDALPEINFAVEVDGAAAAAAVDKDQPSVEATLEPINRRYEERREGWGDELTRRIESYLVLTAIDQKWKDHLHAMDALKAGIGLRGYGQQDPKIAYKKEATELFAQNLLPAIESDVTSKIMRIEVSKPEGEGADEGASAGGDGLAPRGIAPTQQAPQRQVRFDELPLEQQRKVIEQLPDEQKLMAVMQAGDANQATLLEELPPELRERFDEVKRQLEERRAQQLRQQQAMQQAQRGPAASAAFDVMRRRKALEQQQRAAAGEGASDEGSDGGGGEGQGAAAQGSASRPSQGQRPAAAATAPRAGSLGPEFRDAGRNDPCPCGSGKKFKKCHGK